MSAILAGLPAGELSLANTVLSAVIAGGMGVLAASLAQLDATTLPLQVVPALGAVLFARFTSFAITCAVGLVDRRAAVAALLRLDAELVPDRQGRRAARDQRRC